ncbi:MAG: uL15m family ribosomal protein [Nanoarchaeota archaeon]
MKIKKRRKSSRYAGSQTAKRGSKKRTRGSGNQGGKGWAGTGKRADQKKTLVIKLTKGNNYFGKSKALRRGNIPPSLEVINVGTIEQRLSSFTSKEGFLDLSGYKILGDGDIKTKIKIKASAASKSAIEKIKKAGGELEIKS